MHRIVSAVVLLALLGGCSGDAKPQRDLSPAERKESFGDRTPPENGVSLRIEPAEPRKGSEIHVLATGFSLAGMALEWSVNGRDVGSMLDAGAARKGDTLQVRAVGEGRTVQSRPVTVRNSPPEIRSVIFRPGTGQPGDAFGAEAEPYDADGDPVRIEYAWQCNGKPAGTGSRIEVPVKRGDKVMLTVTPFDGEERGPATTLNREIRNSPPVILGQEQFRIEDDVVTFHVRASDPDGDRLTYALREAPPGVRIDAATGMVHWDVPVGTPEKMPFLVSVTDGAGGVTTARFVVTVREDAEAGRR